MENKKKKIFIAIGIICAILSIVGVSYALWMFREVQTKKNLVQLDCFNIEFNETSGSNIQLSNAFPLTDQQGKELDPYQFSISNLCGSFATYQVRIEVKKESKLDDKYLKVMLNQNTPNVLTNENYENSDILIGEDTKRAYIIETGYLYPNEVKNFDLRLWLDENVTTDTKNEDETSVQNSKWQGIITISSSYSEEPKAVLAGMEIPIVKDGNGLYEVTHTDATSMEEGWQRTEYRYGGSNPNNYADIGERYVTDIYDFFEQYKSNFDTEEKCELDRNETLKYLDDGEEVTECISTPNSEGLYFLEYKYLEADYSYTDSYSTIDECQSDQAKYESNSYIDVVHECSQLENIYSYTDIYPSGLEYSSNKECESENEGYEGICKLAHSAGEPISLWRIIGLVNVKTPTGIEQRLKLIRDKGFTQKAWDKDNKNDWTQASLMKDFNKVDEVEGEYYQTLTQETIDKIEDNIIWNIGGANEDESEMFCTRQWYEKERGVEVYQDHPITWPKEGDASTKARVGLMYLSDYGYATSGGNIYNRKACLEKEFYNWKDDEYAECSNNDWLKPDISDEWTISPDSSSPTNAFHVTTEGGISYGMGTASYGDDLAASPVIYLKQNVKIVSGTGAKDDAYELEYTAPPPTLIDVVKNTDTVESGDGLYVVSHKDDGTDISEDWKKDELRYGGVNYDLDNPSTPYVHNYVTFNNEAAGWRIIGLVNVLVIQPDGSKKVEQRLKIIRDKPESKAWDSGGNNDWTKASLMKDFNEAEGEYYKTLASDAKKMIDSNIIWNLGGIEFEYKNLKVNDFYKKERGTTGGAAAPTAIEWPMPNGEGKYEAGKALVGLIYPSDYGYAVGGGKETRDNCLTNTKLYNYDGDCHSYDWLFLKSTERLLSPSSSYSNLAFLVLSSGCVDGSYLVYGSFAVRPTLYLNPNVIVTNSDVADGSVDHPYEFALE